MLWSDEMSYKYKWLKYKNINIKLIILKILETLRIFIGQPIYSVKMILFIFIQNNLNISLHYLTFFINFDLYRTRNQKDNSVKSSFYKPLSE